VNGACGFNCATGYHACSGSCAGDSDPGTCGTSCTPCPSGANGTTTCTSGTCGLSCASGYDNCDSDPSNGCEANLVTDAKNCGSCGRACPSNASCAKGQCVTQPPPPPPDAGATDSSTGTNGADSGAGGAGGGGGGDAGPKAGDASSTG
jgi:hypothetical protein